MIVPPRCCRHGRLLTLFKRTASKRVPFWYLQLGCLGSDSTLAWVESAERWDVAVTLEGKGLTSLRACPGDPVEGSIVVTTPTW